MKTMRICHLALLGRSNITLTETVLASVAASAVCPTETIVWAIPESELTLEALTAARERIIADQGPCIFIAAEKDAKMLGIETDRDFDPLILPVYVKTPTPVTKEHVFQKGYKARAESKQPWYSQFRKKEKRRK